MLKSRILVLLLGLPLLLSPSMAMAGPIYMLDGSNLINRPDLPPKTVVLTFDDGPSEYTPKVLEILREKNVKATFFVVGKEALEHKLLKDIYDDGHEVGNHTFGHADLSRLPGWHLQMELSLSRLIIGSQIDHSTRIFRPPFLGTDELTPEAFDLIERVGDQGYVMTGADIDSEDWRRPGAEQILKNATAGQGGVILMHDGGGDRSQTVEALPGIIDYYHKNGYSFSTIGQALGLPRDQLMPKLSAGDTILSALAGMVFGAASLTSQALYWIVLVLIVAGFSRIALVIVASLIQSRRKFPPAPNKDVPCSVIVPAYNEAAVILSCLKSILASDFRAFELIVVDDGSRDDTVTLARSILDPRLRVVSKVNGGKASALNYGIGLARANLIVAIDADTVFRRDTLRNLMRHFQNPAVGAVSGNTRIANRHRLITKLQSLEYVVGFNLDRRMGDLFDCITVVPGAIGAFRKPVLQKVGGFTHDTLAEDTDLTLGIKEAGYRIVYDSAAVAYTEAPATVRDLLKQRFRWTFGTMQSVWKHRWAFLNPRYGTLGLIGLPYLVIYQILFPLLSPLFDVVVLYGLLQHDYNFILASFAVYTAADALMSGVALVLDGEKLRKLWLIIPQRILYRQLMYYVILKSVVNVLKGNLVGWGALKREGKHLAKAEA